MIEKYLSKEEIIGLLTDEEKARIVKAWIERNGLEEKTRLQEKITECQDRISEIDSKIPQKI